MARKTTGTQWHRPDIGVEGYTKKTVDIRVFCLAEGTPAATEVLNGVQAGRDMCECVENAGAGQRRSV